MSSYLIEDAFRYYSKDFLKNLISPRFLCNSRRFSRITEEDDHEKNLRIIDNFCPSETTKYFRKLTFVGTIDMGIISKQIQLNELYVSNIDAIFDFLLPTISKLSIENPKANVSIDMDMFPKLKLLRIEKKSSRANDKPKVIFKNSMGHFLENLSVSIYFTLENCAFERLFFVEILKPEEFINRFSILLRNFSDTCTNSLMKLNFEHTEDYVFLLRESCESQKTFNSGK